MSERPMVYRDDAERERMQLYRRIQDLEAGLREIQQLALEYMPGQDRQNVLAAVGRLLEGSRATACTELTKEAQLLGCYDDVSGRYGDKQGTYEEE